MRYKHGCIVVSGNPSIAWINKMSGMGMIFRHENGIIIAEFERVEK